MYNIINLLVKGDLFRFISMRVMTINYTTAGNFTLKYIKNIVY